MSAIKNVVITLPAKAASNVVSNSDLPKSASKFNFTTSILMDKIKVENCSDNKTVPSVKHLEVNLPLPVIADDFVFKQENLAIRGKKRRLDHLTWEEKLQRKKLKNRVAAQTSRDRKKAKLDELEETVRILTENNEMLIEECTLLRRQNESLLTETKKLRSDKEIMVVKDTKEQVCRMCQGHVDCVVPALGSAVSPLNPLQQGGTTQMAQPLTLTPNAIILLKILTLYLLSKTYVGNSKEMNTSNDWKNLPKVFCEKLPLKWKQILLQQMSRNQSKKNAPRNLLLQKKWWGRHQVMWKPVHLMKA